MGSYTKNLDDGRRVGKPKQHGLSFLPAVTIGQLLTEETQLPQRPSQCHRYAAGPVVVGHAVIEALQAQFTMTADTALTYAVPQTSIAQASLASSLGLGLQVGLPQSTH